MSHPLRQTDPAGCVHRFPASAGGFECRAHPMQSLLGGTREAPAIVYRHPACVHRCGEYAPAEERPMVVALDLSPEEIEEFKRAWAGHRPSTLTVGEVAPTVERRPGAAYAWPGTLTVEHTDWGDIHHHPDGRKTYPGRVCGGSYAIGNACGYCARCVDERRALKCGDQVVHRFPGEVVRKSCIVTEVREEYDRDGVITRHEVTVKEAYGGREAKLC